MYSKNCIDVYEGYITFFLLNICRSCPEIDDETMAAKIEQFEAPRRQFQEANQFLQEKVSYEYFPVVLNKNLTNVKWQVSLLIL